jgi:diadenosine tetraphosphate (Ap4A) HIT family hydrolase
MDKMTNCFFCDFPQEEEKRDYGAFFAVADANPVTLGHVMIISKAHAETWFDLDEKQHTELDRVIVAEKEYLLKRDSTITGFNLGMNCGKSAGQTCMHFHCHLIPRRKGDMEDPRGGVRGVIPEKQKYPSLLKTKFEG